MKQKQTTRGPQVLIVGGSIVGVSAAAFLAAEGFDVLLVEKHREPSTRLRAKVLGVKYMTPRTSITSPHFPDPTCGRVLL